MIAKEYFYILNSSRFRNVATLTGNIIIYTRNNYILLTILILLT